MQNRKRVMILPLIILILIFTPQANADLDKQKEALDTIADFADRICNKIPTNGSSENLELSGSGKVELNKLLRVIADLGIEGGAKYQKSEFNNVLQKDLANMIMDSSKCKLDVFKELKDKLLVSAAPAALKVSKDFTRKYSFEDHHCSVNEERTSSLCADAGFTFTGIKGQPSYSSKDNCGSQFVSFEQDPNNKQCGIFKVRLVGCGHDSFKICKGHAYIKGSVTLSGLSN